MILRNVLLSLLIFTPLAAEAQTVFMVQLGTFDSQEKAQTRWNDLSEQFPDIFNGLQYTPNEVVKHPDKFVNYRTQAGPIPSRDQAEKICAAVSKSGSECYVAETAMFNGDDAEVATVASIPVVTTPIASIPVAIVKPAQNQPTPPPIVQNPAPTTVMKAPPAAGLPVGYVPSAYATAANPVTSPQSFVDPYAVQDVAPAQAYVPQNEAAIGTVAVQEAIPVPLSEPASNPYLERGNRLMTASPSDSSHVSSFWADIGSFRSETAALQYVQVLKSRDNLLPRTLRIRVTRPYGNVGPEGQLLSLRMGPFVTTVPIRRVCALTRAENLRCRAVKDLGGSVQNTDRYVARQAATRGRIAGRTAQLPQPHLSNDAATGRYAQYRNAVAQSSPMGAMDGQYRVQLGSFLSQQAAEDKWNELNGRHSGMLSNVSHEIISPYGSSQGRLFRLRTVALSDFATANNLCNALKSGGTLCIVVK